jgi:tetratricopeptide (TPR) repeat protein
VLIRLWLALAMVVSSFPPAAAQTHQMHQLPVVAAELLERPITLQMGIAHAHDEVGTSSEEAQKFYDQGLTYLHHFAWMEAARSFNQALRLDRRLALALAGLSTAQVELNQSAAAHATFARTRELAGSLNEHDRRHLDITGQRLAALSDPSKVPAYRKALDDANARFPKDAELWLERGVAESPDISDRGQGSPTSSIRFYNQALAVVPDHFAAHHYLTHAYENGGRIDEALTHGTAYANAAPEIAHARHMRGHDLRRLGRVEDAIAEFEAANRLEVAAIKSLGFPPEDNWHYEHNLDLLGTSYQYTGRIAKADQTLKAAFSLPTANLAQAVNKRQWTVFLRARGRADEALEAARSLATLPHPVGEAIGHIEAGYALMMKKQFAEAAKETNAALAAMKRAPRGAGLAAVPFEGLQGEFFLRTGQREKGRAMLDGMIAKARAAQGPDEWAQALFTLESTARAAREVGDWEFAARAAQKMLEHDPAYGGTHYALALVAEHAGDRATAAKEFAAAAQYWSRADPDFPELAEARRKSGTPGR